MGTALPLDERLGVAAQLVKRARISYDIWWFYEGADTRPRILDTMNVYSEFFRFDTHAHFVSMVIHLAGLFESRNDTINFGALVKEAEADGVSKEAVDKANALMTEVASVPSKVAILRSNLFAHRSASLSYAEAFRKADLKPDQLRDLTVIGLRIANTLLIACGWEEQFFHKPSRRDAERLINDLAKANAS
ncbi:MAG TPA: hypothetical protein VN418_02080 [Gammaproteobacteria bacterium]|nr:hypothetical protein [Gammaproteobacteria bacterium]